LFPETATKIKILFDAELGVIEALNPVIDVDASAANDALNVSVLVVETT